MKLTREKCLEVLLASINDSKYLAMFPGTMGAEYSKLGYTATQNRDSKIRNLLEVQSHAVFDLLQGYELPEPKPLTRTQKRAAQKAKIAQEREDMARFEELERAWKEDEPRAQQEVLDNAEKAAQNIFNKNQELRKTRD